MRLHAVTAKQQIRRTGPSNRFHLVGASPFFPGSFMPKVRLGRREPLHQGLHDEEQPAAPIPISNLNSSASTEAWRPAFETGIPVRCSGCDLASPLV